MQTLIPILTSTSGNALVKTFSGPDLTELSFATGKAFTVTAEPVSDLRSLSRLLQKLRMNQLKTVIRGSLVDGQLGPIPRNKNTFVATPRQWCMIDIDSLDWDGDSSDQQAMLSYAIAAASC